MAPTLSRPASSHFHWNVCALLFFATTINYMDRQVLSILAKTLEVQIGWDSIQYGYITAAFQAAYAIGLLGAGRVMDRIGTRKGFAIAITVWSLAAIGHAFAASAFAFGVARALLGFGEAANFPACIKTVAEWFPKRERALATGIFNSGANIGNIVTPALVPVLTLNFGWQGAFVITGLTGFVWLAFWLWLYRKPEEHPSVSQQELSLIHSDPVESKATIPWGRLIPRKETWAFAIGKFLTDPIWWFYLFWLPDFLNKKYGLDLKNIGLPLMTVYIIADIGSVAGGWLSSSLIKRGWSVNKSRKTAMLI